MQLSEAALEIHVHGECNDFTITGDGRKDEIARRKGELRLLVETASQRGYITGVDISAGSVVGLIESLEPASSIIRRLVAEAELALRNSCTAMLT